MLNIFTRRRVKMYFPLSGFVLFSLGFAHCFLLHDQTTSAPASSNHSLSVQELLRIIDEEKYLRYRLENVVNGLSAQVKTLEQAFTTLYDTINANVTHNASLNTRLNYIENKVETLGNLTMKMTQREGVLETRLDTLANTTVGINQLDHNFTYFGNRINGLEALINKNDRRVDSLNASFTGTIRELKNTVKRQEVLLSRINITAKASNVAFNAKFAIDTSPGWNQVVIFNETLLNIGNVYDNVTGVFTAPADGNYIFNVQMCLKSNKWGILQIVASNTVVTTIQNRDMDSVTTLSGSVICLLETGDKVWIKSKYVHSQDTFSNDFDCWNQFSGGLV